MERAGDGRGAQPKLADGIELIGEYADSGFEKPPFIARRADGQTIQMPEFLYRVAEQIDGRRGPDEIAERVTEAIGRRLGDDDVAYLIDEKLRPLGVVAQPDGSSPPVQKADPMLALRFKVGIVPERVVRAITTVFYPFFFLPVIVAVVGAIIAVDVWLFFFHGVAQSARELVYNPLLALMILALVVLATALHEIGHATAARFGGAKPGVMGAGIYVVWPAFYTDVTDAYRLGRWGRVRTDLGGIYFNGLFVLGVAAAYFLTRFEPLLVLIPIQHFQVLQQMLPFLRLDGYYVLSDLTGVPDLFTRIRPALASMLRWKKTSDRVRELKPWVRTVVSAWVVVLVPVLVAVFGLMLFNAPRVFATAWDSFFVQLDRASEAFGEGRTLRGVVSGMQMAMLVLPAAGMTYSFSRAGTRGVAGMWRWASDSTLKQALVVLGTAAAAGAVAFVWWPNGDYKPIQRGERGTLRGAVAQFRASATGRPGLTRERERELGGAPTLRERLPASDDPVPSPTNEPAGESPTDESPTGESPTAPEDTTQTSPEGTTTEPTETTSTTPTAPTETTETTETTSTAETQTTTP